PRRRGAALAARALGGRRRSSRRAVRARASRGVAAAGSRSRAPPSLPRRARAVWDRRPCRQPPRLRSTGGSRRSRGRARPSRARRDQFVMVGAGLSLLLAACLDRQSLARAPLYALAAWLACSALAAIASEGLGVRAALRLAGGALLIAMPLAVLLFLFFPRLPGAFWAIPRGAEA